MDESGTPTSPDGQPTTDEEYMNFQVTESETDNVYTEDDEDLDYLYTEGDVEQDNLNTTEGDESFEDHNREATESQENLYVSSNPSLNSDCLKKLFSEVSSEKMSARASPLIINVAGILDTDLWKRECMESRTSAVPTSLSMWRSGFIKHIGTVINVKPLSRDNAKTPTYAPHKENIEQNSMLVTSETHQVKLPGFATSVKDRMSIFRGKNPTKFLGKLFITLHDKLITARCKQEEKHKGFLDNRGLFEKCSEKRKLMLDQAKKDALIVATDGKLFGRELLSISKDSSFTASIEAQVLSKYIAVSPMEAKAYSDKLPVHQFVKKVVEEHATVVFSKSDCIICLKLLTLLRNNDIKHLILRLDKMGVYGDNVSNYLRDEYSSILPSNVYFHGLHPDFVKKSYSVIEKNSDSDAVIGLFPDTYDLIVVGGTSLGIQAVHEARRLGVRVCLIDSPLKPSAVQPIAVLGKSTLSEPDVSKKLLYHLLSLRYRARKYQGEYGTDSMHKIHSDWAKLAGSARSLIDKVVLDNAQSVHNTGAGFLKCGVKFIDRHTIEITNGDSEKYTLRSSYFVMANPMQHRIPKIPGSQYCFTPDQIFSLPNSPGKTLIYGSSRSAIEYAGLLGSMGFPVTVMAPGKVMEECDGDMVKCIMDNMKYYGITIIDDCVLTAVKLVSSDGDKNKKLISRSDESLYKFRWNPLLNKVRKKKRQPRRRGHFLRQCGINKMIEQALLAWDVSPKVLKSLVEASPAMREVEETNGINTFDAVAHKKKLDSIIRQKAAIQRWFTVDDADSTSFDLLKLKLPNARSGLLRKRRFQGQRKRTKDRKRILKRKRVRRKNLLSKFINLFLSLSPDEKTITSLDSIKCKKPPLLDTGIRYGPHYSYSPKSRVGVYFPGGTALRLSKKSKYYKYLTPITPSRSSKRRKRWPSSVCKPAKDVIDCLLNLKATLEESGIERYLLENISLEDVKGMRADKIIQEYNKNHFEVLDIFRSHVINVDADGGVSYNSNHKFFEEYMVQSLKNIDMTIKQILMTSLEIDFKSQCLSIVRFLTRIVQILRMFHLYINWKIRDCKTKIINPKKRPINREVDNTLQSLNDNFVVRLECKVVRKSIFEIVKNLESLLAFTFISACNVVVERSNECNTTESEDISNRGSSIEGKYFKSQKGTGPRSSKLFPRRNRSIRRNMNSEQVPFNIRRFYNKSRYIRTCMGGQIDVFDPFLNNKNSRLCFEGNYGSPLGFETEINHELTKSSIHKLNSQLKGLVALFEQPSKVKKIKKLRLIEPEISENIIKRLKMQNADKSATAKKERKTKKIVLNKDSLVSKDVLDLRELLPRPAPDRKKIENLRLRGVRSELNCTEIGNFIRDEVNLTTVTDRVNAIRQPETKFSESVEKSEADVKMQKQIIVKQIVDENGSKISQNLKDNKVKLNFRNFVAVNFGHRDKLKYSLSQRDNYPSKLATRLDAKPKEFKPLKFKSLATYQKKIGRNRDAFVQTLKEKQKVRPKSRSVLYKYGICDSVIERLGMSTTQPRNTNSLLSLVSLQKLHPELFKSSTIDVIDVDSSVLSCGSVINEVLLGTENKEKSSNYLRSIMQNKPKLENITAGQTDKSTCKVGASSNGIDSVPPSDFKKYIQDRSRVEIDLVRSRITDNCNKGLTKSAVTTTCPREKVVRNTIKSGTKNTVCGKVNLWEKITDKSATSSISDKYTYDLEAAPSGTDRSLLVNLYSYIKGKVPVVDLKNLGSVVGQIKDPKTGLDTTVSLNVFSDTLDFYESLVNGSFSKQYFKEENRSISVKSLKDISSSASTLNNMTSKCCNVTDGSIRSPKPTPLEIDGGTLQKDGASNKHTKNNNFNTAENKRQRKNTNTIKRHKKKRRSSKYRNQLELQQLYSELSEDALNCGVIPLDGRAQIEYQLDQRLKKIREEAKSFSDLLEDLKQYEVLSKIVKLCKLGETSRKEIPEPPINVESKLFSEHSVYKVTGKYKYALLDDFKDYFNTIIIAGKQMCAAQDINFDDIGVATCYLNGKLHTNVLDQTTVPTVYGIGECAYGWPFESNGSVIAAKYLVRRLFSEFDEIPEIQICMRTVQTFPVQYAFIGLSEEEARKKYRVVVTYKGTFRTVPTQWFSNDEIPSVLKFVCCLEEPEMEKVVGIHFYNEQAADTIHGYAIAMKNGLYYKEVQDIIAVCPLSTECKFQFDMDRREYENLEINENSKADSFESYSSSLGSSISPFEEIEPEHTKAEELSEISKLSDERDESFNLESGARDEHESSEDIQECSFIESEEEDIPESLPEDEINEKTEEILEEILEEEEEINSNTADIVEEEMEEESNFFEFSNRSIPQSVHKADNLDSVKGTAIRSHSGDVKLTTDTSETRFLSVCVPEEESSTPHYTPEDISTFDDTVTGDGFFISTDGGGVTEIIKKRSSVGECADENQSSVSEETSSASFRTATGYCDSASSVGSEYALVHQKELDSCEQEFGNCSDSVQSLSIGELTSEEMSSESSELSGRILSMDTPDVFVYFNRINYQKYMDSGGKYDDDSLETKDLGTYGWSSPCPYGPKLVQEILRASEYSDDSDESTFGSQRSGLDALLFNTFTEDWDSDSIGNSMINLKIPTPKKESAFNNSSRDSMNTRGRSNVKLSNEEHIDINIEEQKSDYCEGYIERLENIRKSCLKFQHIDKWKRRHSSEEIVSQLAPQDQSKEPFINSETDDECLNQIKKEQNSDSNDGSRLLFSTHEGKLGSAILKRSKKRIVKYTGKVNTKQRRSERSQNEKQNLDSGEVHTVCAKESSGKSEVISADPQAGPSVAFEKFRLTESSYNASETAANSPHISKTKKFTTIRCAARSVLQKWINFENSADHENSETKNDL